jgi:hypothetical protein
VQIMSPHYVLQPRKPVLSEAAPAEAKAPADRPASAAGKGR